MRHNSTSSLPLSTERFTLVDGSFTIAGRVDAPLPGSLPLADAPLPQRTVTFANGLFGNRGIARNLSQELIQAALDNGEQWNIITYSETASYAQDDHTAAYMRVNEYIGRRLDGPLLAMGYSRGCVSAEAAHRAQPELIGSSVYIAPPACTPLEKLSRPGVIAKAAQLAIRDSNTTLKHLWDQTEAFSWRHVAGGLQTSAVVGASATRHLLANLTETIGEICEVLQPGCSDFTRQLVSLQEQTAATTVFSCEEDAFCPSENVERALKDQGYAGDMYRLAGASHVDVVARPYQYASAIVRPLSATLD